MKKIVTFGEIMLRLATPDELRFNQARVFEATYGGGEANVAVSLSNYGLATEFVTRLPKNDLGQACMQFLRQYGVGTNFILLGGNRLGVYFLENGVVMRGSQVIYDRANSSFSTVTTGMFDWESIFKEADWFHWTGITPAVSSGAAQVCLEAIKVASQMGLTISCDLNYRAKLWQWGKTPSEVMNELVSYSDIVIGNEEDAEKVFGIKAPETDVTLGNVTADKYQGVCESLASKFPKLITIAITLRSSYSASHNTWSGILWHAGKTYTAPIYDITHIVDRVGSGDSFMGGLIYGLRTFTNDPQKALDFAVASSALKHTIQGDFNLVSISEVEKLMKGDGSGRVSR